MMRAPVIPNGWPRAIAPPFTFSFSIGIPRCLRRRDHLRRERLVDLDEVHVVDRHPGALESLTARPDRSEPHDLRVEGRDAARDDPRERPDSELVRAGRST